MSRNIEHWIDNLMDEVDAVIHLSVVPTPRGWSAKILEGKHVLLDSKGEIFMIKEGSTVEQAIVKLDGLCLKDLKNIAEKGVYA